MYFTVKDFSRANPAFSEASIRWLIHNADTNGLRESGALLRNGRRILLDDQKFNSWLVSRQSLAA